MLGQRGGFEENQVPHDGVMLLAVGKVYRFEKIEGCANQCENATSMFAMFPGQVHSSALPSESVSQGLRLPES